jgi:hypothetical protein
LATLTIVAYGDAVPITAWGRFFAEPAGILASAFGEAIQTQREVEQERKVRGFWISFCARRS